MTIIVTLVVLLFVSAKLLQLHDIERAPINISQFQKVDQFLTTEDAIDLD
jgi:hypothetical protein